MSVSVFSLRILTWQKSFLFTEILQNSLPKKIMLFHMVTGKVYKTHHKTLVTEMNF